MKRDMKSMLKMWVSKETKADILEHIKEYLKKPTGFFHITSLNPENILLAKNNTQFALAIDNSQIRLIDGIGVSLAARLMGITVGERTTGVEMMTELLKLGQEGSLRVVLIGGGPKVAERMVNCQKSVYPRIKFFATEGIIDISKPTKSEENKLLAIVADFKPHIVLVAFGSPAQELWLYKNRHKLAHCLCMGVGGGFDFLSGRIPRAPAMIQKLGLEWLFRLARQPRRLKRQLKLAKFVFLVIKEVRVV